MSVHQNKGITKTYASVRWVEDRRKRLRDLSESEASKEDARFERYQRLFSKSKSVAIKCALRLK